MPSSGPALTVRDLELRYEPAAPPVVDLPALHVAAGTQLAITGASGAGKTSLAYLLCGIERPSAGGVTWGEVALDQLGETARDRWRRRQVGLVFQDFHLVPQLSLEDNVLVSCYFERLRPSQAERERARAELAAMGVPAARRDIRALSRGEQQRVALARALWHRPPILIADEPTASLDRATGAVIVELLIDAARAAGSTLIVVTHDQLLIERMARVLTLGAGRLLADSAPPAA